MRLVNDFNTTVKKALDEIDPNWESYPGIVVCGTHAPKDVEETINQLKYHRENDIPALGICAGYQMMAVEYARNVLKRTEATSEEWDDVGEFVVTKRDELNVGWKEGESWWNNYEVEEWLHDLMIRNLFTTTYNGVQYHPEYQSSKEKPHKVLVDFLSHAKMAMQSK